MGVDVAALLAEVAPQAGIGGLLLVLLVLAWRNHATERGDYRTSLDAAETRHRSELERVNTAHDQEIAELRERLDTAEARIAELSTLLDEERRKRWHAEDAAAQARREAGT